jgi:hypothetical protein
MADFKDCDWREFYGDVKEPVPPNMPKPRGKEIEIRLYVDSDHAGDQLIRRSRTGFFVFLNSAPLIWYSKRQPTVETSVFGADLLCFRRYCTHNAEMIHRGCMNSSLNAFNPE